MAQASGVGKKGRYLELKRILEEQRRDIAGKVRQGLRESREESARQRAQGVTEPVHNADADVQEDIVLALIEMKSETLNKINEALRRLDEGTYGNCDNCGDGIAEKRLRALPFAVSCKDCEEAREDAERRERTRSRGYGSLFVDRSP